MTTTAPDPEPYNAREHAAKLGAELLTKCDAANEEFLDLIGRNVADAKRVLATLADIDGDGDATDAYAARTRELAKLYRHAAKLFGDSAIVAAAFADAASYRDGEAYALEQLATMQHAKESIVIDESATVVEP